MPPNWTATDIVDLTGRQAVVTGANSGIGFRTALQLVAHRAHRPARTFNEWLRDHVAALR